MCIVTDLAKTESLSPENILHYIDDYSIYCHYIGEELEIGTRYSSPLRTIDENPSFGLFRGKHNRIYFKDHAIPEYKGDVFQFIRILMGDGDPGKVSFNQVLRQIDSDFNLGLYSDNGTLEHFVPKKLLHVNPKEKERYYIQVTSHKVPSKEYLNYWKTKYDIEQDVLNYYNASNVSVLHYSSKLRAHKFQIYPKGLCIAYQIGGRYEIYFPFEIKDKKFQNDLPYNWIKGFIQLRHTNDFVIITKAMKEVMFFRQHFDWDSVAGKSETTTIPEHLMKKLFNNYRYVLLWLDNDATGHKAHSKYLEKYPNLIPITYKEGVSQKDVTDRYEALKKLGLEKIALNEIKELIYGNITGR